VKRSYLEAIREAVDAGDRELALDLLDDLMRELPAPAGLRRCSRCSFVGWPGRLEDHELREHSWRWAA
jgi:hypothetical protein